jgi:hypothetical protein
MLLLTAGSSAARAADAPLTTRFAQTLRGDARSIGNTLMSCPASSSCTRARSRANGSALNNDFTMSFVDTDGDSSTSNSSSADLTLPAGATVAWAGLYWGADSSSGSGGNPGSTSTRDRVRFRLPGGSYQTIDGAVLTSSTQTSRYRGFADVTSLVAGGAGSGRYWVGNVQAGTGADRYAGWALIVAYRDATQPIRRINVLDGLATVGPGRPLAATVAPFFTPASGAVRTNSGVLAFEGDAGITGDSLTFNGRPAADGLNPSDNVFNSTLSVNGASVSARNPSYANTLGLDLDSTTATGALANGQSSAALAIASSADTFFVSAFYLVSDEGPAVNTARPAVTGTPRDASVLNASTGAWNGTPTISYAYEWQRCTAAGASCATVPGATTASYTVTGADVDSTLRAVVTARNDAGVSAPAVSSVTARVTKRPPVNASLPVVSGTVRDGSPLSTTLGTWTGSGPFDYTVRWLRCDADGAGCAAIPGAAGTTYTATADDVGHALRSEVTAANGAGNATARSAATAAVSAVLARNTRAPSVSGPDAARVLAADSGSWEGTLGPIAYRWQRCSAAGDACADIAGATERTYVLAEADGGRTLRVAVTMTNAAGAATALSAVTRRMPFPPPLNLVPPAIGGRALRGAVLTARPGAWRALGTPVSTFHWQRCDAEGETCAPIAGAVHSTYTATSADVGRTLRIEVTVTNDGGSAAATSNATGTIAEPPVVSPSPSVSAPKPTAAGGVAGSADTKPAADVATVPGSLVADSSCALLRGTRRRQATLPGIGVVVVSAVARGAVTAAAPLRLTTTGGRATSVRYALDGAPLASGRRASLTPARLGEPGVHTVTVTLRARTGGDQTVSLPLRTAACLARFTGARSSTGLRLRVDARTALTGIDFIVPAKLLPRQTGASRPVGTLRLLVAGEAAPRTAGLVLPAKGSAPALLGAPSVRYTTGGLLVSGLPAGTAAVELRLTRVAALDGVRPRGTITLRAKVRRAGARARTLSLRTR